MTRLFLLCFSLLLVSYFASFLLGILSDVLEVSRSLRLFAHRLLFSVIFRCNLTYLCVIATAVFDFKAKDTISKVNFLFRLDVDQMTARFFLMHLRNCAQIAISIRLAAAVTVFKAKDTISKVNFLFRFDVDQMTARFFFMHLRNRVQVAISIHLAAVVTVAAVISQIVKSFIDSVTLVD